MPTSPQTSVPDERVEREQLRFMAYNTPMLLGSTVVVASSMAALLAESFSLTRVLGWWGAMLLLVVVRLVAYIRYRRHGEGQHHLQRWWRWYILSTALGGTAWGMLGVLFVSAADLESAALVVLVLCGMMGGAVGAVGSVWSANIAFSVPCILPMAVTLLMAGTRIYTVVGVLCLYLLAVSLSFSRRMTRELRHAIALRFENEALVASLTEARQVAESASRAKTVFLAAASHDLRQPTHALGLFLIALRTLGTRASVPGEEVIKIAQRMQNALTGLGELLHALLDVSRLDADVVQARPEAINVPDLLEQLADEFAVVARDKKLGLRYCATDIWVHADPIILRRILANLLTNAVRYTVRGGVLVTARPRGQHVLLQVWDTGIGIPEDQVDTIFQEFYQGSNARASSERRQGMGLGLSIVQRSARLLGTRVTLRSRLGRGSVFSLVLPACAPAEHDATPLPAGQLAVRETVLVIDDDENVLHGMRGVLDAWGHVVHCAPDAGEALALAAQHAREITMVISDHRLAEHVNSLDLLGPLKAALGRDVPVIILTGDTSPELLRSLSDHAVALVHKPLTESALKAAMAVAAAAAAPLAHDALQPQA